MAALLEQSSSKRRERHGQVDEALADVPDARRRAHLDEVAKQIDEDWRWSPATAPLEAFDRLRMHLFGPAVTEPAMIDHADVVRVVSAPDLREPVAEVYALGLHEAETPTHTGRARLSELGRQLHAAKVHARVDAMDELVRALSKLVMALKTAGRCEHLVIAPAHGPRRFSDRLGARVADAAGVDVIGCTIRRRRVVPSIEQLQVDRPPVGPVVVLDDVYRFGSTIDRVAQALSRASGTDTVPHVTALCVTVSRTAHHGHGHA